MQLSRTWERGDTQANAASAEQLPSLLGKLPSESSFQFGKFVVVHLLLKIKKPPIDLSSEKWWPIMLFWKDAFIEVVLKSLFLHLEYEQLANVFFAREDTSQQLVSMKVENFKRYMIELGVFNRISVWRVNKEVCFWVHNFKMFWCWFVTSCACSFIGRVLLQRLEISWKHLSLKMAETCCADWKSSYRCRRGFLFW